LSKELFQVLDLQPTQKKTDERVPRRAKNTIGCHFPWRTLMAARATTKAQPFTNFNIRGCNGTTPGFPEVRPTAIDATSPMTTATYNHISISDIIDNTTTTATTKGVHAINRKEDAVVGFAVDIPQASAALLAIVHNLA